MDASSKIKSVVMGPGAGEYIYDVDKSKVKDTVDKMMKDYPNIEKVSIVVGWFGDSVEAGKIDIAPRVESKKGEDWKVGDYTRSNTQKISVDSAGNIKWGGTPTDESIMEVCSLLKSKGIDVTLYPMLFIDDEKKSWRGEITAKNDADVKHFFQEYNKFVMHYASLEHNGVKLKDVVSDFIIGSEFQNLTPYKNAQNQFKTIEELKKLAADVKKEMGPDVKLTYAANWSEYHHTDGGWYHMDALWADKNIDYIGLDAYFRLTDENNNKNIDPQTIKQAWASGIDYDYYIENGHKKHLDDKYAIKNFEWFWKHKHVNPDGKATEWQPKMKPIVFTEVGFTAIDKTTNEPYKYSDPQSGMGNLPDGSTGKVDIKFQYDATIGTIQYLESVMAKADNAGMIADITWYNIDPTGHGADWNHNHELKIAEYEQMIISDHHDNVALTDNITTHHDG